MSTAERKREKRRELMLEGNLLKIIPIIALPQVVTMLIDSIYNISDTYFVSQIGDAAMAAVSVNDSLMQIIRSIAFIFGMGASSYISRLLGANKDKEASRAASTTLFSAVAVISFMAFIFLVFLSPLVDFLGATETVKPYSMDYAMWTLIFSPCTAASVCLSQSLRGEGSTAFAMIGSASGCIVNLVLDPIFISVIGLGVAGAAIATGISKVISVCILLIPYLNRKSLLTIRPSLFTPKRELYWEIFRMGVPVGIRSSMMTVSSIIINNLAAGFGDVAMAAIGIANKSMRFVASAIMGFGQGFQPIAGFCWGAKRYGRVRQAFLYTIGIGMSAGAILGALFAVFSEQTVAIFTDNPETISIGRILIVSQSIVLPAHVAVLLSSGIFQATGKPIQSAILGLSRQVFSLIPCVIIFTELYGLNGLSRAQAVADVLSFFIALALVLPMLNKLRQMERESSLQTQPSGYPAGDVKALESEQDQSFEDSLSHSDFQASGNEL